MAMSRNLKGLITFLVLNLNDM